MKCKIASRIRTGIIAATAMLVLIPVTASRKNSSPPVEYSALEQGEDTCFEKTGPEILIFTENDSFESFYTQIHRTRIPRPEAPRPNFKNSMVVFFSYGRQKSAGYSIEIIGVYARSSTAVVKTVLNTPPEDSFQAQKITHPYMLILIPKDSFRSVQLKDKTGKVLASAEIPKRL